MAKLPNVASLPSRACATSKSETLGERMSRYTREFTGRQCYGDKDGTMVRLVRVSAREEAYRGERFSLGDLALPHAPTGLGSYEAPGLHGWVYVENMVIKIPESSVCLLPDDLVPAPLVELVRNIVVHDRRLNARRHDGAYAYLTVTRSLLRAGSVQRQPGWHVDGYVRPDRGPYPVQRQYTWADLLTTTFYTGGVCVDPHASKKECFATLNAVCERDRSHWRRPRPLEVVLSTAHCPHKATEASVADDGQWRTFVRVSFSVVPFATSGNTANPLVAAPTRADKAAFHSS